MKKTRNSFFTEAGMSYSGFNPNVAPNMMPGNMPYQAQTSYNSFYSGPNNIQGNMPYPQITDTNTIENRLAKIERQINRLEHRISKLEATNTTYITEEIDTSSNMYML